MAKFKTDDLLNSLKQDVQQVKEAATFFANGDRNRLAIQPEEGRWSVVQILEHLNGYNRHYLPVIDRQLAVLPLPTNSWFTSGYWGEKFTKMMKPTNVYEIKNKMKTQKRMSFPNNLNVETVLTEFVSWQDQLLQMLERSKGIDLAKIHIPISITKLIKLRLGDTFRFLIAHEQRHMIQARNNMKELGIATDKFPVLLTAAS